jgi:ubiquinone/menaquinone biosynthesis C-methylase UbiE
LLGPLLAGETFLDVGCGGGFYALEAKRAAMRVCAVDAALGMVERVSGKVDEAHVSDVETLHFSGRTFNRVVCAGVMDFVVNPEVAIENLMRQVGPGGVLVVLAPRRGLRGAYYQLEKRVVGLRINLFTAEWFEAAAQKNGFRVTSLELPLPHNLVVRLEPKPDCARAESTGGDMR